MFVLGFLQMFARLHLYVCGSMSVINMRRRVTSFASSSAGGVSSVARMRWAYDVVNLSIVCHDAACPQALLRLCHPDKCRHPDAKKAGPHGTRWGTDSQHCGDMETWTQAQELVEWAMSMCGLQSGLARDVSVCSLCYAAFGRRGTDRIMLTYVRIPRSGICRRSALRRMTGCVPLGRGCRRRIDGRILLAPLSRIGLPSSALGTFLGAPLKGRSGSSRVTQSCFAS